MFLIDLKYAYFQIVFHPDSTLPPDCSPRAGLSVQGSVLALKQFLRSSPGFWLIVEWAHERNLFLISIRLVGDLRVDSSSIATKSFRSAETWGLSSLWGNQTKLTSKAQYLRMLINIIRKTIFLTDCQILRVGGQVSPSFRIFCKDVAAVSRPHASLERFVPRIGPRCTPFNANRSCFGQHLQAIQQRQFHLQRNAG